MPGTRWKELAKSFGGDAPLDRAMELAHLRLADRHIAEGELRIIAQGALVERLRAQKRDTGPAEDCLELLLTTMALWHHHRDLILASLDG